MKCPTFAVFLEEFRPVKLKLTEADGRVFFATIDRSRSFADMCGK